jgi:hypothetical protein
MEHLHELILLLRRAEHLGLLLMVICRFWRAVASNPVPEISPEAMMATGTGLRLNLQSMSIVNDRRYECHVNQGRRVNVQTTLQLNQKFSQTNQIIEERLQRE